MFTKCPLCGALNKESDLFCLKCGNALKEDPQKLQEKLENYLLLLKSTDKGMKQSAIKSLGELQDDKALEALIENLQTETDWELRKETVMALKDYEEEDIITALTETFRGETIPEVRITIVKTIQEFNSRDATNLLIEALKDSFADIQQMAITALGNKKDRKALDPLFDILKDEHSLFREDARISIEKIDPEFLKFWYREEEQKKIKIEQRKKIPLIIGIISGIIIVLIIIGIFVHYSNRQKIIRRIEEGKEYLYKEDYSNALQSFNEVIVISPEEPYGHYGMGLVYLNKGENTKALESLRKAVELERKNPEFRVALARAELANEHPEEAKAQLDEALKLNKEIADIYLYMGESYFKMGNKEMALQYFNFCKETYSGTPAGKKALDWIENWNEYNK